MIKKLSIVLFIAAFFTSCNWKDEDYVTPNLLVADDDFQITSKFEANKDNVDFTFDELSFNGRFNQTVSWNLTITGLTSGAQRKVYGESDSIYTTYNWDGSTDGDISNPILFAKEDCAIELNILGYSEILRDTVHIDDTKDYGILFSDFENGAASLSSPWFDPSTDDGDVFSIVVDSTCESLQGTGCLVAKGTDVSNDYFIGNIGYNNIGALSIGVTDPDELYFNVYVYGEGPGSVTKLEAQFFEGDLEKWVYQLPTTHTGWKYYGIPYSSFKKTEISQFGDEKKNPDNIRMLTFLYSSVPSGGSVDTKLDYPIITVGGPLFK